MSKNNQKSPNRGIARPLSSISAMLLCSYAILPSFAGAQSQIAVAPVPVYPKIEPVQTQPSKPIESALAQWQSLTSAKGFSFASYASFLVAHPGWPGEMDLRKEAEKALTPDSGQPWLVSAFFTRHAPLSATSWLRFAEALSADGKPDQANNAARKAWTSGPLSPEDEARLLSRYSASILPTDHDARMDKLLWQRTTQTAARQLPYTSPAKRAFFDARLAYLTKASDAEERAARVDSSLRNEAGFVADRSYWFRSLGNMDSARAYLGQSRRLSSPPSEPATWLDVLEANAKSAAAAGQWSQAYGIARQLEGSYAPGVLVRDRSLAERDSYTNIAWLGGTAAMDKLGKPGDAIRMFELYGEAARTAQTKAKGYYWAARAAEKAGRRDIATMHYTRTAEYFDQFHGQLASAKLGRPIRLPATTATVEVSGGDRSIFERNDLVRAMVALGARRDHETQTKFVRTFANSVETEAQHALGEELAKRIDRPDLALLVGKSAREKGFPGYFRPLFPTIRVPDEHKSAWTMIHAITRQESQFDKEARSRVGARGLMQLMPGTARETAPSAGIVYSPATLTQTDNNVKLGATYFAQMMDSFNGSYVLSVAAYNAGPGNARKFIRQNGDPRLPGVDIIRWIEDIPLTETRGYVMRVLENAVVYDLMNPQKQGRAGTPLASFLGQQAFQAGAL